MDLHHGARKIIKIFVKLGPEDRTANFRKWPLFLEGPGKQDSLNFELEILSCQVLRVLAGRSQMYFRCYIEQ
jgi:hypothetical protein